MRRFAILLSLLCAACAPPAHTGACLALRPYLPIQVDQADTVPTKKAVLRANIAHNEACPSAGGSPWETVVRAR